MSNWHDAWLTPLLRVAAVQRGSVPGSLPGGESSKLLKRRTIRLPCASKRELQQATKQELVMDTAVRVRHYLVQTKTGRCVITINTMPDAAAAGGKQWLPGGKYMAPRVLFAMPLSTFAPEYEKFCMQTKLQTKDVSGNAGGSAQTVME